MRCGVRNRDAKTDQNAEQLDHVSISDRIQSANDLKKGQIFKFGLKVLSVAKLKTRSEATQEYKAQDF